MGPTCIYWIPKKEVANIPEGDLYYALFGYKDLEEDPSKEVHSLTETSDHYKLCIESTWGKFVGALVCVVRSLDYLNAIQGVDLRDLLLNYYYAKDCKELAGIAEVWLDKNT